MGKRRATIAYKRGGANVNDGKKVDLGILGGGQLARMLLQAASALGLDVAVMENEADSPAGRLTQHEIVGAWDDEGALARLAASTSRVVLENEFVPSRSLSFLESRGVVVTPHAQALALGQDKLHQKTCLRAAGLPTPAFMSVETAQDVYDAARDLGWPLVLKRRRNGYDGYGNRTLYGRDDVAAAVAQLRGPDTRPTAERALLVEAYVPFVQELAVMVVRSRAGRDVRSYPVVETVQQNHICRLVHAPAHVTMKIMDEAGRLAREAVAAIGLAGVAGVEMFVAAEGAVLLNEVAPRVHNSGHYTIEACVTSQFENAVRAAVGLPLGTVALSTPAACMVNVLGAETPPSPEEARAALNDALAVDGAHVHVYGKRSSRPGRKMGHVTALGHDRDAAMATALRAAELLRL